MSYTRRTFAKNALSATAAFSLPAFIKAGNITTDKKLKIVCAGGHPDDPESGCGGTLAKLAAAGHEVTIIYLTSGEAGINGKSHAEAGATRIKEAIAACKILNAKPVFAGQIDGAGMVDNEWVKKIHALIESEKPDIAFTHWPIDTHKDHQCASLLTIQSWVRSGKVFELYFFEVCTGAQTMGFKPTDYVDITATKEQKRKALFCHTSQNPAAIYVSSDCNPVMLETFRGIEINVPAAEAFVRMGSGLKF